MSRIQLTDNIQSACVKIVEGNPGALSVCVSLLKEGDEIDPHSVLGGLGQLLALDTEKIYGSRIWMLYKDVCRQDLVKTIAVLRGCQLGFVSTLDLNHAIDNYGSGLNVDEILVQVKKRLPNFGESRKEE